MAEEAANEKKEKNTPVSIHRAHGQEQQIKMDVLDMVNRAEDPFAIIYHLVKWLGEFSGEPSYAKYVEDQIRAVYGLALQHVKPMQDELAEVEARLKASRLPTRSRSSPKRNASASASRSSTTRRTSSVSRS